MYKEREGEEVIQSIEGLGARVKYPDHVAEVARMVMILRGLADATLPSQLVGAQIMARALLEQYDKEAASAISKT